jgi:hypothetical protein
VIRQSRAGEKPRRKLKRLGPGKPRDSANEVAAEGHRRLFKDLPLREEPPPTPREGKPRTVKWADKRQVTDLVTPFACADYPAGGAPSIRSRRSDGATVAPATMVANNWLRQGEAERAASAPKVAHPGGAISSNAVEAKAAFLKRKSARAIDPSSASVMLEPKS